MNCKPRSQGDLGRVCLLIKGGEYVNIIIRWNITGSAGCRRPRCGRQGGRVPNEERCALRRSRTASVQWEKACCKCRHRRRHYSHHESTVSSDIETATLEEAKKAAQDTDTLVIRVKEKNIFINEYMCADADEFGKVMEELYEDGMNVTVVDDYADSEPYSAVTGYLKDNAYEYMVETK